MKALAKTPNDRYPQCADLQADLAKVRKSQEAVAHRFGQAALDRYRLLAATIEERRRLAQSLGRADIDRAASNAIVRLAARFPEFAKHTDPHALMEPMESKHAQDALSWLQTRHNAEQASLAALKMEAANPQAAGLADLTLHRATDASLAPPPAADPDSSASIKDRAAALWKRFGGT